MIFKSGCHNKQLTFGRLISLCKNINRAGGLSIRQPATFFTVRVQTGSDWGYFWGYLRKLNEYNSLKINWMFSDVMFLLSHHSNQVVTRHLYLPYFHYGTDLGLNTQKSSLFAAHVRSSDWVPDEHSDEPFRLTPILPSPATQK